MARKPKVYVTEGQPVTVDISSWSLDIATDKVEQSYVAGLPTESVTIKGFWGPEDAICIVCQRSVDTKAEVVAECTTDTEPEEYLGIVCKDCCLKAIDNMDKADGQA